MKTIVKIFSIICMVLTPTAWAQGVVSGKADVQAKIPFGNDQGASGATECWSPFGEIEPASGRRVRLQFPQQGVRWLMRNGDGSDRNLSSYGQMIYLRIGEKLELIEKHSNFWVELVQNLDAGKVFLKISQTSDKRSVGGTKETKSCEIFVADLEQFNGPPSMNASRAANIAADFLAEQPFKDQYEPLPSSTKESADHVDVHFKRKKLKDVKVIPAEGMIQVDKKTWRARWILLE